MFERLANYFDFPGRKFAEEAKPPINTPDEFQIEQQPYHWVFDHNNSVHSPCAFEEAYTDQKFYMWKQNHITGTPPLIFNCSIHPQRMSLRARLKGKLHIVPADQIKQLDILMQNRVDSERKRVRLVFPMFAEKRAHRWDSVTPMYGIAWVYFNRAKVWEPKFAYDFDFWRGRKDTAYVPAEVYKDPRQYISDYFQPIKDAAHQPRCTMGHWQFSYNKFKSDLRHDDLMQELYSKKKKRKNVQVSGPSSTLPKSQLS